MYTSWMCSLVSKCRWSPLLPMRAWSHNLRVSDDSLLLSIFVRLATASRAHETEHAHACVLRLHAPSMITSVVCRLWRRLRLVNSSGAACSRCRWTDGCVGCFIPPTDEPCPVRAGDTVGVDWHMSVIKVKFP